MNKGEQMKPSFEQAQALFTSKYASDELRDKNAEKWIAAVQYLGERWILAKNVTRKENK